MEGEKGGKMDRWQWDQMCSARDKNSIECCDGIQCLPQYAKFDRIV